MSPAPVDIVAPRATMRTVLRRSRFALLVLGQTVSQLGDKLQHMALIALVGAAAASGTGGLELAKLSVVFTAPVVLFGPLAGALVDRWNRRITMIVCDALRALLVASIPFIYHSSGHLWAVYVVSFLVFLLGTFFNAAKMSLIPDLVPRHELLPANAVMTFVGRVATVVGIVGGGVIIGSAVWSRVGWTNYAAGFYLDAMSYVISVLCLVGIVVVMWRGHEHEHVAGVPAPDAVRGSVRGLMRNVHTTVRLAFETPGLRFVFGSLVLLALFASTVYVVMTVSVQTLMGRGTAGVGYLGGLLAGGMVIGSFLVGSQGHRWRREQLIGWGIATIGVLMILAGAFFSFRVFAPVAFIGGALLAPVMVAQDTMLHEFAPAGSRGVVFSTKDLVVAAVFACAAFVVGGGVYLLDRVGVREPYRLALVLVGGTISLAAVAGQIAVQRRKATAG
jgi:MFS family permease